MSADPDTKHRPALRFELLGSAEVPVCTGEGCKIPLVEDGGDRREAAAAGEVAAPGAAARTVDAGEAARDGAANHTR